MKKIFFMFTLIILCGCGPLSWFFGTDDKGNDLPGDAPFEFFSNFISNMGPIGTLGAAILTVGGSAYVSHKKGKAKGDSRAELAQGGFKAVVKGIQDAKDEMSEKDKGELVAMLKKKIPNKWHGAIRKIKDTL